MTSVFPSTFRHSTIVHARRSVTHSDIRWQTYHAMLPEILDVSSEFLDPLWSVLKRGISESGCAKKRPVIEVVLCNSMVSISPWDIYNHTNYYWAGLKVIFQMFVPFTSRLCHWALMSLLPIRTSTDLMCFLELINRTTISERNGYIKESYFWTRIEVIPAIDKGTPSSKDIMVGGRRASIHRASVCWSQLVSNTRLPHCLVTPS